MIAEHYTALFIVPLFVWLPSLFADRKVRSIGVCFGGLGFALAYAIVRTNLESARPHIGSTHGVIGVFQLGWMHLAVQTLILYAPTTLALYYLERVLGDITGARLRRMLSSQYAPGRDDG